MLDDELTVIVVPKPSWQTVSVATVIDGGRMAEPQPGITRLLTDSWLASRPGGRSVTARYDRMGARTEIRVQPETTVFWAHGPRAALTGLLALERQRFADPLLRVGPAVRPSRTTVRERFRATYLDAVFSALYPESHPYHGLWRADGPSVTLASAARHAQATWTPSRATLVVAGPVGPEDVACALQACPVEIATHTAQVGEISVLDGDLAGWAAPIPPATDIGPVEAGVPGDAVLVAWALPGIAAGGGHLARWAVDEVEARFVADRTLPAPARCQVFEGQRATSLVCVVHTPAAVDLSRMRKRWERRLDRPLQVSVAGWRTEQLVEVLGATDDPAQIPELAEQAHHSGSFQPMGGSGLGFDDTVARSYVQRLLGAERMVVVRLVP